MTRLRFGGEVGEPRDARACAGVTIAAIPGEEIAVKERRQGDRAQPGTGPGEEVPARQVQVGF